MGTLILTKSDVAQLLDMPMVIHAVESALVDLVEGRATMPPKTYLSLPDGDFRAMPAALPGRAGVKWVNVHTGNPDMGLPTVMGIIIYSDPRTGYPLAVMDATGITAYRTGATSAIAAKYLARKNVKTIGLIGAGQQAYTQLNAHLELFEFERIYVYDVNNTRASELIEHFPAQAISSASLKDTCKCDILCSTTPVRKPIIKQEWIQPGTHINAVGADAPGKQELDEKIILNARLIVDDLEQAGKAGEINVPVSRGTYSIGQVGATLGEVVAGRKQGRTGEEEITVFDSTGIAIEDIAVAGTVYEKAKAVASLQYGAIKLVD